MKSNKSLNLMYSLFATVFYLAKTRKKTFICVISLVLAVVVSILFIPFDKLFADNRVKEVSSKTFSIVSSRKEESEIKETDIVDEQQQPEVVSEPTVSSEPQEQVEAVEQPTPEPPLAIPQNSLNIVPGGKQNTDIEDNDFLDALVYCGYNLAKHRSDGLMWQYILCADKPWRGWLSNITYGGGCSGYETTADGKPNIARFEHGGLVCASYATYVYFNYLPNVVGVDTSALDRPERSYDANCWYIAGQKWVEKGYSRYIEWTAKENGTRTIFTPAESIPIGSLMLMTDFKNRNNHCTHICLYAGYSNGYHWVTHVGNSNGPEFCAMERMSCGPDPQWPLKIITTPNGIVKE